MAVRNYPQRIVCLAAEAPEIFAALGVLDKVVGVSSFTTRPPAAAQLPRVGGFSTPNLQRIQALEPDLVVTLSDIQAPIAADLIKAGYPVLALNPHRLSDVWRNMLWLGATVGRQAQAEALVDKLQAELAELKQTVAQTGPPPRVFFEEWPDPLVSGIGWVADLIEAVGGVDVFPHLRAKPTAAERVISLDTVAKAQPDVIIASWCGKPADLESLKNRPNWQNLPAIQQNRVYEIDSAALLQTGPSLIRIGAVQLSHLFQQASA